MKCFSWALSHPVSNLSNMSQTQPFRTISHYGPRHHHSPLDDPNSCLTGFLLLLLPCPEFFTQHRMILLEIRFLTPLLKPPQWPVKTLQDGTPVTWNLHHSSFTHSCHTWSLAGPQDGRHTLVCGFFYWPSPQPGRLPAQIFPRLTPSHPSSLC